VFSENTVLRNVMSILRQEGGENVGSTPDQLCSKESVIIMKLAVQTQKPYPKTKVFTSATTMNPSLVVAETGMKLAGNYAGTPDPP